MEHSQASGTDTRMMGVVHDALRRDLTRTAAAVSAATPPPTAQRAALAAHLRWMMDFLHRHHAGEDDGLWPLVRRLDPSVGSLLDQMSSEHDVIGIRIDRLVAANASYERDGSDAVRRQLIAALAELREVLDPHLLHEEGEMMPVVGATLSQAEWEAFNQEHYVKPKPLPELGMEGHWLLDGVDSERYQVVVGNVPPVQRFVLLHAFARRYRRECAARWGAAVSVGPQEAMRGAGRSRSSR